MALSDNLAAHYLLLENADDQTGNYHGTEHGGVSYDVDGALFDGVDGYIDTGYKVSNSGNTYTISAWVKRDSTDTRDAICSEVDEPDNSAGVALFFQTDDSLYAYHWSGEDTREDSMSVSVSPSLDMMHVVLTRSNSVEQEIFIDGVSLGTSIGSEDIPEISTYTLKIGGVPDYSADPELLSFGGHILNTRIYTDIKDQTFIDELFAEGAYPEDHLEVEIFQDVSEKAQVDFEVFQDVSEKASITFETFQDVSEKALWLEFEIFVDKSKGAGRFVVYTFKDISKIESLTYEAKIIERVNE